MLHAKSMKTKYSNTFTEMGPFLLFWSSQSFSALGSAMTGYALVIWSYTQSGSALKTAMLILLIRIPVGYLLGGVLVDYVFEPIMARQPAGSVLLLMFGAGKGSGTAFLFGTLGIAGVIVCLYFRRNKHIRKLKEQEMRNID